MMKIPNALDDYGTGIEVERNRGIVTIRTIDKDGKPSSKWADIDIAELERVIRDDS